LVAHVVSRLRAVARGVGGARSLAGLLARGIGRSYRIAGPLALVGATSLRPASLAAQPPTRWPTWPTEVGRVAAFLARDVSGKAMAGERERLAAMQELDRFATGAILPTLLHVLDDESPQVRREALRMCFEREVVACVPGAARWWEEGGEPTVRVAALKVLALDPEPERTAILIDALRDPSEVIRAQAAELLGLAPLAPEVRHRVRTALLAKLADASAVVRRRAVLSLGLLGPGDGGTLSIARLLDDAEPSVQAAAAEALGQHRDPTAAPTLRRSLLLPHEPQVAQAIVEALALLPDPAVEADLLGLLDDPPAGLDEGRIAQAIGRRPDPGDALVDGLVERLDEPLRRAAALTALLMLGEHAQPALAAARARGLAPAIDVEVERLLAALEPPPQAAPLVRWPAPDDRAGWRARVEREDEHSRWRAAHALAKLDPPWRVPVALAAIATPGPLSGRRAWVLALAAGRTRWSMPTDAEPRARLEGWARDRTASTSDRCLALAALGAHAPASGPPRPPPWADLAEDPHARVRACAALALGRQGDPSRLPGLLVDDRPRVRAAAALALALVERRRLHRSTSTRLAVLSTSDPAAPVRAAARRTLERGAEAVPDAPGLFLVRVEPYPWRDPPRWIEVDDGAGTLWLPAEGSGPWRWALVPGLAEARTRTSPRIEIAPSEAFGGF
jgi:HEAT repeat protein